MSPNWTESRLLPWEIQEYFEEKKEELISDTSEQFVKSVQEFIEKEVIAMQITLRKKRGLIIGDISGQKGERFEEIIF
jgi:hypothetical protein